LLLAVKAKLVSVDEGIETMEQAFLAHIIMPDGRTVGDHIKPRIATAYRDNKMVPLLPHMGNAGAGLTALHPSCRLVLPRASRLAISGVPKREWIWPPDHRGVGYRRNRGFEGT
jgi:hypothetical protein